MSASPEPDASDQHWHHRENRLERINVDVFWKII